MEDRNTMSSTSVSVDGPSQSAFSLFQCDVIEPTNEYIEDRTLTDDEATEEIEYDGLEHEVSSPMFTELNMEAVNSMSLDVHHTRVSSYSEIPQLHKGLICKSKEDLQNIVKRYHIANHRNFKVIESKGAYWSTKCKLHESGCGWRLRATRRSTHGMFEVTQYPQEHTCVYSGLTQAHKQLDSSFIAREIREVVKSDPTIKIGVLQQLIKDKFEYNVSYGRIWEAKRKAIALVFGDWEESYQILPKWMNVMQEMNPGTQLAWRMIPMGTQNNAILRSVFWAFGPSIEGFNVCRPIIQIDGTHLYGKYKGKLLIATSLDSNNHIFPLAFAIVDEENEDTWGWFLACLRQHVTQRDGICLISNRHDNIIAAVNNPSNGWAEPQAYHRFCLRHITSNFNNQYKSKFLKDLVYRAVSQLQVRKFDNVIEEIKHVNKSCLQFFESMSVAKWTLAHDGGHRYACTTTNLSECLNGVLKGGRMLPITALVQLTYYRCVYYFHARRGEISAALARDEMYTRYALNKIENWKARSSKHDVIVFDRVLGLFEVITGYHPMLAKGGNKQVVKLTEGTCTCNKWQSFGIPCSHVIAVCSHCHIDYRQYVEKTYLLASYASCYAPQFHPIPHEDYWPVPDFPTIHPNKHLLRQHSRPQSSQIKNEMD